MFAISIFIESLYVVYQNDYTPAINPAEVSRYSFGIESMELWDNDLAANLNWIQTNLEFGCMYK